VRELLLHGAGRDTLLVKHLAGQSFVEIDGQRFSFAFFGFMSNPNGKSLFRLTKGSDGAVILEETRDENPH
jgi:hypothetical protein